MFQPITEFAPDVDPTTAGIITSATNIVPTVRGYAGAPTSASIGLASLPGAASGAAVCQKLDGTRRIFVGTATALKEAVSFSWSDVSRAAGGGYSAAATRWRFSQFGDASLATQKSDTLQRSTTGAFANITGAPKASCIATASGFVMLADTLDGTYGDSPDRWWCCALNDETSWTPALATQSATGRLVDTPGKIVGLVNFGPQIVAYKERSMYLGTYVGSPAVWQFQPVPGDIGAPSQEAVVNIKTAHVFMGYDDFYTYDGSRPQPIGGKIRKWFFSRIDPSYRQNVIGTHDRASGCVWFFYPTVGSSGVLTDAVIYNYRVDKWGVATQSIECSLEYYSPSVTYDSIGSMYSTYDDIPAISYESPFWTSSTPVTAVIDTTHTIKSLSGACASSSMTLFDMGDDEIYTLATKVKPRYQSSPTSATLSHYQATNHGDTFTLDSTATQVQGKFDILSSSRWHRLKFDFTGDYEVMGVSIQYAGEGTY